MNYMADAINEVLNDMFSKRTDICKCDKCRSYIINRVAKHLCSIYTPGEQDKSNVRVQGVDNQLKADAAIKINEIIDEMKNAPLHKNTSTSEPSPP